jgi:hypothetical protein
MTCFNVCKRKLRTSASPFSSHAHILCDSLYYPHLPQRAIYNQVLVKVEGKATCWERSGAYIPSGVSEPPCVSYQVKCALCCYLVGSDSTAASFLYLNRFSRKNWLVSQSCSTESFRDKFLFFFILQLKHDCLFISFQVCSQNFKMRGISWLAANRLAAQEGLCCMEWVSKYFDRCPDRYLIRWEISNKCS